MASGLTQETTPGIGDGKQDPVEPPETDSTDPDPTTSESTSTGNIRKGDANEDGNVDISDVVLMNRVYVGVDKVTPQGLENADIDGSGKIELSDSMNVLRYLVHLVEEL